MKISRSFGYALNALIQLASAENDTPTACSKLAAQGEMPERFLLQILRLLVNYGLLTSTRGVVGGYQLARPADEISLHDVLQALANASKDSGASIESLPALAQERLNEVVNDIEAANAKRLQKVKIAELVKSGSPPTERANDEVQVSVKTDESIALRQSDV